MEREISQTLENTKRDFEMQKQHIFQEQVLKSGIWQEEVMTC